MAEKPILFSGEMVRAILSGRKTQTRRVVKPQPIKQHHIGYVSDRRQWCVLTYYASVVESLTCPYGKPGDQLWVRETWADWTDTESVGCIVYKADNHARQVLCDDGGNGDPVSLGRVTKLWDEREFSGPFRWRPSIHMPRWASRVTLTVKDVRVERLNEISEADAKAEGVNGGCLACGNNAPCGCDTPSPDHRDSFIGLWDRINADRGYGWASNPWVWVVEFEPAAPAAGQEDGR